MSWQDKTLNIFKQTLYRKNPTQAELDNFHKVLQDHADEWIKEKKEDFNSEVTTIETKAASDINDWDSKTKSHVKTVWDKHGCCLAEKSNKIRDYHSHLENMKINQRCRLSTKLINVSWKFSS